MKKMVLVGNLKKFGLDVSDNVKDDAAVYRKSYDLVAGKELEGEQTFLTVMSTSTPDADGEVIISTGIDTSEYQRNPILLWQHDRSQPCIGKCTETLVDNRGLMGKFKLATTEFAQEYGCLLKINSFLLFLLASSLLKLIEGVKTDLMLLVKNMV